MEDVSVGFQSWAILELMGHRKLAGMVREVEIAGGKLLRIDVPGPGADPVATQFYGPAAIYCMTPVTEETARKAAQAFSQPAPLTHWELPAPERRPIAASGGNDPDDDPAF